MTLKSSKVRTVSPLWTGEAEHCQSLCVEPRGSSRLSAQSLELGGPRTIVCYLGSWDALHLIPCHSVWSVPPLKKSQFLGFKHFKELKCSLGILSSPVSGSPNLISTTQSRCYYFTCADAGRRFGQVKGHTQSHIADKWHSWTLLALSCFPCPLADL